MNNPICWNHSTKLILHLFMFKFNISEFLFWNNMSYKNLCMKIYFFSSWSMHQCCMSWSMHQCSMHDNFLIWHCIKIYWWSVSLSQFLSVFVSLHKKHDMCCMVPTLSLDMMHELQDFKKIGEWLSLDALIMLLWLNLFLCQCDRNIWCFYIMMAHYCHCSTKPT